MGITFRNWPIEAVIGRTLDRGRSDELPTRRRRVRLILGVVFPELLRRARRRDVSAGLYWAAGDVLTFDHADRQFLKRLNDGNALASNPPVQAFRRGSLLRAALDSVPAGIGLFGLVTRVAGGTTQKIARRVAKAAFLRVAMIRMMQDRPPSAVVVAGDLVLARLMLVLAASELSIPIVVVLNDQDHRASDSLRGLRGLAVRGVLCHDSHDACSMRPLPEFIARFPVDRATVDTARTSVGIVLSARASVENVLRASSVLLRIEGVERILIRRHPRDVGPRWPFRLPECVEYADESESMAMFGDRIVLAVCDPSSSATVLAARAGIICFSMDEVTRDPTRLRARLQPIESDERTLAAILARNHDVELRSSDCTESTHPQEIPFRQALAIITGPRPS